MKRISIRAGAYYDSVTLMAVSQQAAALPGITEAALLMGTDMNKELLGRIGLLDPAAAAAGPTDLIVALMANSDEHLATAFARIEEWLGRRGRPDVPAATGASSPRTLAAAAAQYPQANLALISVPGAYAAREARQALSRGLHVMLYSDNVSAEDELALKKQALEQGLLMMGPDAGTAVLNGVGLGFANAVGRGNIGIVAASGTGAQELSTLIDRLGGGISQLIGVGGRDLSAAVGGLMTIQGIKLLQADPGTAVIAVVSKPPGPAVADDVQALLKAGTKPYVLCMLGPAGDIDTAAIEAVALAGGGDPPALRSSLGYDQPRPQITIRPDRPWIRGLYSGGTLCDQALFVLEDRIGPVFCNVHPNPSRRAGNRHTEGHILTDFGADEFTQGRPHPMIDPGARRQSLMAAAANPKVGVVLLDIVLGYGTHPDPAGALASAIAAAVGAGVAVVTAVTGSERDRPGHRAQRAALERAGAIVLPTARLAALAVADCMTGRTNP